MRKPRRAKLTIETPYPDDDGAIRWVRLTARNGEILMSSEGLTNAKRSRAAIIRSMVDVLESEGYVVAKAEEAGR